MLKFLQLLVFILLVSYVLGKADRIAGGSPITKGQFPFFAQLYIGHFYNNSFAYGTTCGGTLIEPSWILTAAHCFKNNSRVVARMIKKNRMVAFMGTEKNLYNIKNSSSPTRYIDKVYTHPYYFAKYGPSGEIEKARSDVALAKLRKPFELGKYIQTIALPHERINNICKRGMIIGAGKKVFNGNYSEDVLFARVNSKTLEEVDLPAYITDSAFFSWVFWYEGHAMEGDSGGPFVCYETQKRIPVQYGIMSFIVKIHRSSVLTQYETITKHMWFIKSLVPNVKVYKHHQPFLIIRKPTAAVKVQSVSSSVTLKFSFLSLHNLLFIMKIILFFN